MITKPTSSAATRRQRWLAAPNTPSIEVRQGIQTFSDDAFDVLRGLVTKVSYELLGPVVAGKAVFKLVALGQGGVESVDKMLQRQPLNSIVEFEARVVPNGTLTSDSIVAQSIDPKNPVTFTVQPPNTALGPVAPGSNWALFFPRVENSKVANAQWRYVPAADDWSWGCKPGFEWQNPDDPDSYVCVPKTGAASAGGGGGSGVLIFMAIAATAIGAVALSGGGRKSNPAGYTFEAPRESVSGIYQNVYGPDGKVAYYTGVEKIKRVRIPYSNRWGWQRKAFVRDASGKTIWERRVSGKPGARALLKYAGIKLSQAPA